MCESFVVHMRIQWSRAVLRSKEMGILDVTCHGTARGEYSADAVYRLPPGVRSVTAAPITVLSRIAHDEHTVFAHVIVAETMVPDCFHSIWDLSSGTMCVPGIRVRMVVSETETHEPGHDPSSGRGPLPHSNPCEVIDTRTSAMTTSANERVLAARSMLDRFSGRLHWKTESDHGHLLVMTNLRMAHPGIHLTRQVVSADGLCVTPRFHSGRTVLEEACKILGDGNAPCDENMLTDLCTAASCKRTAVRVYLRTRVSKTGIARSSVVEVDRATNEAIMGFDLTGIADGMALRFVRVHTFGRYVIVQDTPGAVVRQTPPFDAETTVDLLGLQTAFDRNESKCPMGDWANGGDPANGLRVFHPPRDGHPCSRFLLRHVDTKLGTNQVRVTCTGTTMTTIHFEKFDARHNYLVAGNTFCGLSETMSEMWEVA